MKHLLIVLMIVPALTLHAQKVRIKKGIVYVDNVEYMKVNKDFGNEVVSMLNDKQILKFEWHSFDAPNPAHRNTNNPGRHNYPATRKVRYAIVSFLDYPITFETDQSMRTVLRGFFIDKVVDAEGNVDVEKAKAIAKKIHKNVSGDRPNVIFLVH